MTINNTTNRDCPLCIDWMTPSGVHPVIGPVYRICPQCFPGGCHTCHTSGMFPANGHCLACFLDTLATAGWLAHLCPTCLGVLDVIPIRIGGPS
jgi:hypothetical protein